MSNRCCGFERDHVVNAFRADAIASSRSLRDARANSPMTSPVFDGLMSALRSVDST
jgi:hypothetical protein